MPKLQSEEHKWRLNVEVKNEFEALRDVEAKIKRKNLIKLWRSEKRPIKEIRKNIKGD